MSRNYVDENGNLIQIAGKGIGVAEWGTPISGWLDNTSSSSPKRADKDGVFVIRNEPTGGGHLNVYDKTLNMRFASHEGGSGQHRTLTVPIIKGNEYYLQIESGNISSFFYPFKENNNLQMVREKYSTEETVIGEYLGKPLYRRVIEVPTIILNNNNIITHNIGMKNLVAYGGDFKTNNVKYPIPYTDGVNRIAINYITENQFNLASNYGGTDGVLWFEYTKTTD